MSKKIAGVVKILLFLSIVFVAENAGAENMLRNGDLEGKNTKEFVPFGAHGHFKFSIYAEDLTWNRCARLEILNYLTSADGHKLINAGILIGGAKGGDGRTALDVKPDTTYEFSLKLRGTVKEARIAAYIWKGAAKSVQERTRVTTSLGHRVKVHPDWVGYKGTFTTDALARKAVLFVQIWSSEKYGLTEKPGTFVLVDHVTIREKTPKIQGNLEERMDSIFIDKRRGVVARFEKESPKLDGKLDDPAWENASVMKDFHGIRKGLAKVQTEGMILATPEALWIGIRCFEPNMGQLKIEHKKDGVPVWKDDSVEIFFDTLAEGITLRQFVVNAGGYRMMGWGKQPRQPRPDKFNDWEARAYKGGNAWTIETRISYEALGWDKRPPSGKAIRFNLARGRYADTPNEFSSWSPVRGSFHRKEEFGVLVFGDFKDDIVRRLKQLKDFIGEIPPDIPEEAKNKQVEIEGKIAAWEQETSIDASLWEKLYLDIEQAEQQARFLRLAGEKFVVTVASPTDDFALPFIPDNLLNPPSSIKVFAAVNEFESLPVVITNLTDTVEAYRVVLFKGVAARPGGVWPEIPGLQGKRGPEFPPEAITLREAVRIRDSDGPIPGKRLDPLPLMNEAFTITVPPRDSGLVWVTFDCRDILPGTYAGTLRIIPLNQPGKFELKERVGWQYEGLMRDIPLKLTVWPIELSKAPAIPLDLMRQAPTEKFFICMKAHGNQVFQMSPWWFPAQFEPDGSIKKPVKFPSFDRHMDDHLRWMKEDELEGQPRFFVGFSAYRVFERVHTRKKFTFGTAAWKKAWTSWIKEVEKAFKKYNLDHQDYVVEVWDEAKWEKYFDEVLSTLKLAKQASPQMQLMMYFGYPVWPLEKLEALVPYLDVWGPHESYWQREELVRFFEELRKQGEKVWFYACDTNLSVDLYRYHRLHAWRALYREVDVAGMFAYIVGPGGYRGRGSWKIDAFAGLVYRSFDGPIPSIRYQVLREGFDDIKFMAKLREVTSRAKKEKVDKNLTEAAELFLSQRPKKVAIEFIHKKNFAEESRRQAARMIIELQKALKR